LRVHTLETAKSEIEKQGVLSERTLFHLENDFAKYDVSMPEYLISKGSTLEEWKRKLLEKIEDYLRWWALCVDENSTPGGKGSGGEERKADLTARRSVGPNHALPGRE